jgi:hypothetical protein
MRASDPPEGTRIRLDFMGEDDPNPVPVGTLGTVLNGTHMSDNTLQVSVRWDNGRALSLVCPPDRFTWCAEQPQKE